MNLRKLIKGKDTELICTPHNSHATLVEVKVNVKYCIKCACITN